MFGRFFYDTINIIRRAFYYGKKKETCTSCTNDRRKTKHQKDISDIDQKVISMYAKGMSTRQISETIEDIYGFETSESLLLT